MVSNDGEGGRDTALTVSRSFRIAQGEIQRAHIKNRKTMQRCADWKRYSHLILETGVWEWDQLVQSAPDRLRCY